MLYNVLLGGLMLVVIGVLASSRMSDINTEETSAHQRIWAWEQSLDIIRENPVIGVGKGQFMRYSDEGLLAHNIYLEIFSEMGFIGIFAYIGLIYFSAKGMYVISRFSPQTKSQQHLISSATILLFILAGLCSVDFFISFDGELFFFIIALCTSVVINGMQEFKSFSLKATLKDFAVITGIIICLFVSIIMVCK